MTEALVECPSCGTPHDAAATRCPRCRASTGLGLARVPDDVGLERLPVGSLLARVDAGLEDLLARDLSGPLAPTELRDALARVEPQDEPSLAELERALGEQADAALEGVSLAALLDDRAGDTKTIKRGLALLKARRWSDAIEWWTLHREQLSAGRERFHLLLLLMESFTCRLAGDARRAEELRARVTAHPVYLRLKGKTR